MESNEKEVFLISTPKGHLQQEGWIVCYISNTIILVNNENQPSHSPWILNINSSFQLHRGIVITTLWGGIFRTLPINKDIKK